MTIKSQGGVFGRNPTFNEVTADGGITSKGDVVVSPGRIGVGTVPNHSLHVANAALTSTTAGANTIARFQSNGSGADVNFQLSDGVSNASVFGMVAGDLYARTNNVERIRIAKVTGDITISTGNLVIGTSGTGIDFSATSGTGTSELFDDYEEGTWTPSIQQGGFSSITVTSATYTKVGRVVCARASITFVGSGIAETLYLKGLPFNVSVNGWTPGAAYFQTYTGASPWVVALARSNTAFVSFAEIGDDVDGNEVSGYCGFQVTYETT